MRALFSFFLTFLILVAVLSVTGGFIFLLLLFYGSS